MAIKRPKPEEIVVKLRQVELLPRKYTHTDIKKPQKTLKEAYLKQ